MAGSDGGKSKGELLGVITCEPIGSRIRYRRSFVGRGLDKTRSSADSEEVVTVP